MATTKFEKPMGSEVETLKTDIATLNSKIKSQVRNEHTDVLKPSDYAQGITIQEALTDVTLANYEGSGVLITFKFSGIRCYQLLTDYNATTYARGSLNDSTWTSWKLVVS